MPARSGWRGGSLPFIEVGVGFNPDLTARENVTPNGVMVGLSQREARRLLDAVLDFAELDEFVDLKLKNYSSGMLVRLAFSVMIQAEADILLIDKVVRRSAITHPTSAGRSPRSSTPPGI